MRLGSPHDGTRSVPDSSDNRSLRTASDWLVRSAIDQVRCKRAALTYWSPSVRSKQALADFTRPDRRAVTPGSIAKRYCAEFWLRLRFPARNGPAKAGPYNGRT